MKRSYIFVPLTCGVGLGLLGNPLKEINRLCKDDGPPPKGGRGYRGKLR